MKEYINVRLNEKGQVSLLMTLVVMSILLYSVLFVINMNLKEIKIIKNTEKSMKAFYIADSGIEKVLYELENGIKDPVTPDDFPFTGTVTGLGSYTVEVINLSPLKIKTTGTHKDVARAIEVSW